MLVLNHLSQAGRIDSLKVESHSTTTYGCVQFYVSGPGDYLLNNEELKSGQVNIRLWKAKDQPGEGLKMSLLRHLVKGSINLFHDIL